MLEFFNSVFLESPLRLGLFSFALFAVALFARRRLNERYMPYVLPGVLGLIGFLFITQWVFVTDREQIVGELNGLVQAVESKNAARIARHIDDGFDSAGLTKSELLDIINGKLTRIRIYDTSLSPAVTVEGDMADMILGARATVSVDGAPGEFHVGTWQVRWARRGDKWLVVDLRPVRLDTIEIRNWRELQSIVP